MCPKRDGTNRVAESSVEAGLDGAHGISHRFSLGVPDEGDKRGVRSLESAVNTVNILTCSMSSNRQHEKLDFRHGRKERASQTHGFNAAGYTSGGISFPVLSSLTSIGSRNPSFSGNCLHPVPLPVYPFHDPPPSVVELDPLNPGSHDEYVPHLPRPSLPAKGYPRTDPLVLRECSAVPTSESTRKPARTAAPSRTGRVLSGCDSRNCWSGAGRRSTMFERKLPDDGGERRGGGSDALTGRGV